MLMQFWLVQRLTRELNTLERKAMEKHIQLTHYQNYSSMLGGTSIITLPNIAGMPAELLPRASMFAQFSNQASSMNAMNTLAQMKMTGMVPYTGNPMMQYQLEMSAFARLKEQSMKALKQQEANVMNEKEKEIQLELNSIEQNIKMKRAMLDSAKQEASRQAQNSAPTFGNG